MLRGVSVAGVDISGMTEQEARDATASIESDLLSVAMITIDVDGQLFKYDAVDFDLHTGYDKAIADATAFGHSGSFDERKQASDNAKNEGADFAVDVYLDEDKAKKMVSTLKALVDTEPVEAGFEFMPYGYLADGTPYEPTDEEIIEMIKANAGRKEIGRASCRERVFRAVYTSLDAVSVEKKVN